MFQLRKGIRKAEQRAGAGEKIPLEVRFQAIAVNLQRVGHIGQFHDLRFGQKLRLIHENMLQLSGLSGFQPQKLLAHAMIRRQHDIRHGLQPDPRKHNIHALARVDGGLDERAGIPLLLIVIALHEQHRCLGRTHDAKVKVQHGQTPYTILSKTIPKKSWSASTSSPSTAVYSPNHFRLTR